MEKLTRYRIPLLTAGGALLAVIIVFAAWISPEGAKVSSLKAKQTQLESQQSHLQIELFSLRRDKAHMASNCAELTKDLTEIPGTPTVDDFFHQVSDLAVTAGDPNTPSIDVTQAQTSADGVKIVTVSLSIDGTYGQMMAFLKGLDSFPRLFTVNSIGINGGNVAVGGSTVSPSAGGYTLTLAGSVFYSAGQANVCAGATSASTAS